MDLLLLVIVGCFLGCSCYFVWIFLDMVVFLIMIMFGYLLFIFLSVLF